MNAKKIFKEGQFFYYLVGKALRKVVKNMFEKEREREKENLGIIEREKKTKNNGGSCNKK